MDTKIIFIVFYFLFFLYSCSNQQSKNVLSFHYKDETIYNYKNFYENDTLLMRVEKTGIGISPSHDEVWIYDYGNKNMKYWSEKQYMVVKDSTNKLFFSKTIEDNKRTIVYMEGDDTISIDRQYYNSKGDIIRDIYRDKFLESLGSDNYRYVNKEETFSYDDNNQIDTIVRFDYIKNTTTTIVFSYETKQDTLIKKTYHDSELFLIDKIANKNNCKITLSFTPDNNLESKVKEIKNGKDSLLVVNTDYISNTTDSIQYVKGKEIWISSISNGRRFVILKKYDHNGNIIQEVEIKEFN